MFYNQIEMLQQKNYFLTACYTVANKHQTDKRKQTESIKNITIHLERLCEG